MKIVQKNNRVFQPITLEITLETQAEYNAFYQVANHSDAVASSIAGGDVTRSLLIGIWRYLMDQFGGPQNG